MLKLLKEVCQHLALQAHTINNFHDILKRESLFRYGSWPIYKCPILRFFEVIKPINKNGKYSHYSGQPIVSHDRRKDLKRNIIWTGFFRLSFRKPFTKENCSCKYWTNCFPRSCTNENPKNKSKQISLLVPNLIFIWEVILLIFRRWWGRYSWSFTDLFVSEYCR